MTQNIRLVAYRNDVSYPLDLLDAPNVSLNFKFTDIKNPQTRQSSYSYTFKLPFTDNNNIYFQDWHNSNVTELTNGFSTNNENQASLFVNEIEQFVGVIVLKGTYNKAKYYDVMLLSQVANIFSSMGAKLVKDAFVNYTTLNHVLTETKISQSWNNTMGADFQDSTGGCSKIVYPVTSASEPLLWKDNDYLNNDGNFTSYSIYDADAGANVTVQGYSPHRIQLTSQKPAIQLRTVLERIFATNGFTWTSTFLDSVYFRRLYMTTCNFLGEPNSQPPFADLDQAFSPSLFGQYGYTDMRAIVWKGASGDNFPETATDGFNLPLPDTQTYANITWDQATSSGTFAQSDGSLSVNSDGTPNPDSSGFLNIPSYHDINELQFVLQTNITIIVEKDGSDLITPLSDGSGVSYSSSPENRVGLKIVLLDENDNELGNNLNGNQLNEQFIAGKTNAENTFAGQSASGFPFQNIRNNIPIDSGTAYTFDFEEISVQIGNNIAEIPQNSKIRIKFIPVGVTWQGSVIQGGYYGGGSINTNEIIMLIGKPSTFVGPVNGVDCVTKLMFVGNQMDQLNTYGLTVSVPECIDPSITQKGFIKDLTDRFNLVIQQDKDSPTNLLIEPMTDFLASSGETKFWTDKLDTSKEVFFEPTTSMKYKDIILKDLPDKDFLNKFVSDFFPSTNPHGKFDRVYTNTSYNTGGTLSNASVFSPYIVEETPVSTSSSTVNPSARRMLLHRNYSYDDEGNITFPATKPKLFYYGGSPVTLDTALNTTNNFYLHYVNATGGQVAGFDEYPLCSAFEVDADNTVDAGTTQIDENTKALRFDNAFIYGGSSIAFNYSGTLNNTLYEMYYANYLSQLYHPDTRLMTAYFNLNEVDIAQFKFNDEIFIKDAYYRILDIENYQAGTGSSVKVKLIKIVEKLTSLNDYTGCDYYPVGYGSPFFPVVTWGNATDNTTTIFVSQECCAGLGYTSIGPFTVAPYVGFYICINSNQT